MENMDLTNDAAYRLDPDIDHFADLQVGTGAQNLVSMRCLLSPKNHWFCSRQSLQTPWHDRASALASAQASAFKLR